MHKLLFITVTLVLSACSNEPTYDVQHYIDNPEQRAEKLAECRSNPGEKSASPNCVNASSAENKAMFKGKSMPSIQ